VYEAWRLSAPEPLVEEHPLDRSRPR
jgi:hypothetical protein